MRHYTALGAATHTAACDTVPAHGLGAGCVAIQPATQPTCKTRENSNFWKKGKMVILFKIQNFSRSRMTKRTSPLESSRGI